MKTTEAATLTQFDQDTATEWVGPNRFAAQLAGRWRVGAGVNGGYLAAIILRALTETVGDPTRHIRSLTIHYLSAAVEGPAEVSCWVERQGRSLTTVSARMEQRERTVCLALGAFSSALSGRFEHDGLPPPPLGAPRELEPLGPLESLPEFTRQFEYRFGHGSGLQSGDGEAAESGGWLRLREPRPVDPLLIAALADAWFPAVFVITPKRAPVPTIDLTIHFRRDTAAAAFPDGNVHVLFSTRLVTEGFCEEDGLLWDGGGRLIAQSRQLALVQPLSSGVAEAPTRSLPRT
jgi:acyl-CoA thioesterase